MAAGPGEQPTALIDRGGRGGNTETGRPRVDLAVVLTLVVAAALIRSPGLAPSSLWLDDTWIALVHKVDDPAIVARMGVTAPGFALVLRAVFALVGFSSLSAQLLPFLAAVAAPPGLFLLARRWGAHQLTAATGAALILLSPTHVTYSTNVKQFTLDLVLALILIHLAREAWDHPAADRRRRLALAAATATMISASVAPIAVTAVLASAVPALRARRWDGLVWPAAYLGYAAALALLIRSWVTDALTAYWTDEVSSGPLDPVVGVWRALEGFTGSAWLAVLVGLSLLVVAVRGPARLRVLLLGPVLVAMVASFAGVPLGTGRTDLYLYASFALAVVFALETLRAGRVLHGVLGAGVLVAMAVPWPVPGYGDLTGTMQEDTRPLVETLVADLEPGERVVTVGAHFALALYGPFDIRIHGSPPSPTGWWPVIDDDRMVNVAAWPSTPARLRAVFPDLDATVVHVLVGHFPAAVADEAARLMEGRGYRLVAAERRPGAWLGQFERAEA